ncbi:M20/M25/M40 family metallo-hydrolase [Palleronia caenipelagi]|uniref:M20/M25/M40 family metallo-hydrolase n=1 Tax=Palleronia caenipelagi TaxID=2489174 RepID=UPI001FE5916F|nr:M20/M25/M40 family metallo-hydrolase [Palleronia caenipelagi]
MSGRLRSAAPDALLLPSGATHDASAMADLCPVAMLFVRCRSGISHHLDEDATAEDMSAAISVLARLIHDGLSV